MQHCLTALISRRRVPIGGSVLALVVFGVWRLFWVPPIERVARDVCMAYAQADAATLERWEYDEERRELGMDRAKIQAILDRFVAPRLAGFRPTGRMTSEMAVDGSQGMAYSHLTNAQGQRLDISATPWRTDDGPRVNVLYNLLCNAWRAEYVVKRGLPTTTRAVFQARLEGLRHDVPELERLGVRGFVRDTAEGGIIPWRDYEALLKERLARMNAKAVRE